MQHSHHLTLKHRILIALTLAIGGFAAWYVTRQDMYFKLFEFSAAPFVDKMIFAMGATE